MKGSSVFARLGLTNAAQKFIPIYHSDGDRNRLNGVVVVCLLTPLVVGTVIALLITAGWGMLTSVATRIHPATALFVIGIPLFSVIKTGIAVTKGFQETRYIVFIKDLGYSGLAVLFVSVGAFVFEDLSLAVIGYLLSLCFGVGLAIVMIIKNDIINLSARPKLEVRKTLGFSMPLTVNAVAQYLVSWTDIFMLGILIESARVGWYQATFQTAILLSIVFHSANAIFPSIASDLYHNDQREKLDLLYSSTTKVVAYLTVLGYLFLVIYAGDVLHLFGDPPAVAITAITVLGLGQMITSLTGPVGYLLMMSGYERLQTLNTLSVALLNIVLNYILIQSHGIVGAAVATAVSLSLLNCLRLIQVWYLLKLNPYNRSFWKGGLAIAATIPIMILGKQLSFNPIVRAVFVGCIALAAFLLVVYGLGIDESQKVLLESLDER